MHPGFMNPKNQNLTLTEVLNDERDSLNDIAALGQIIAGLRRFIEVSYEDRRMFRTDLMRWERTLSQAQSLHNHIVAKRKELENETNR